MRLRLAKVNELQFLRCLKEKFWGANRAQFKDWEIGEYLVFIIDEAIAGFAVISGAPFVSKQRISQKGVFPYRIPIQFIHVLSSENRMPVLGEIQEALVKVWGDEYEWGIQNQLLLTGPPAELIIHNIRERSNDLPEYEDKLESLIEAARLKRDMDTKTKRNHVQASVHEKATKAEMEDKHMVSKEQNNEDLLVISHLIRLGKVTGSSVFIGSRHKDLKLDEKKTGGKYLTTLPSLGVEDEVAKCLTSFDVVWIKQNKPICAFSIETPGSSSSDALLSMSDLFSIDIDMNIKLFMVAPKESKSKLVEQLARPTFQKIGLSDSCQFISVDDLGTLLSKVEGLEGHVKASIINTISTGFKKETQNSIK